VTRRKQQEPDVFAGAATVHDGLFLLLKRSSRELFLPNVWGIPAGQVKQGEDPRVACVRELTEETGLRGRILGQIGNSTFRSERNGIALSNVQLNFLVQAPECEVKLNHSSHSDSRWISLDDVDNELLDSFTRRIMILARQFYKKGATAYRPTHSS
jgi:8-oxo-dGTP diphosphatase